MFKELNKFPFRIVLFIAFACGICIRIWSCLQAFGIWWKGDEAEYVNMAWLLVQGYGVPSLDLRSPFFPLLLTLPLKVASLFAVNGRNVMLLCRFFTSIFSISLLFVFYLFTKKFYNKKVATIATILLCFSAPIIEWTPRVMTEIPSIFFLFLGLLLALSADKRNNSILVLASGAIFGFSYLVRFNFAIFLIPMFLFFFLFKKKRLACLMVGGFVLIVLLGGLLDFVIWGEFFKSPIRFYEINVLNKHEHGDLDVFFYIRNINWFIPIISILSIFSFKKNRKTLLVVSLFCSYLLMISFTPNYDLRYGVVLVPFILMMSAEGLLCLFQFFKKRYSTILLNINNEKIVSSLVILTIVCLSIFQIGNSSYVFNENATKATLYLNGMSDVEGVITVGFICKMGEYIYLQKNVPIYEYTTQEISVLQSFCQKANYVIIINEWYLEINSGVNQTFNEYNFFIKQNFNEVYVLKKNEVS